MATKLDRKTLPTGTNAVDFQIQGRPSRDQDDFGTEVGVADMACVNQFGEANNAKYYHASVVTNKTGAWFVYLEWGRLASGRSWDPSFRGGDYQFVACDSESDARRFFQTQCRSKNVKRLVKRDVGGVQVWTAKEGDDGYLVQDLATRTRGLPDTYKIVTGTPVVASAPAPKTSAPTKTYHPEVVRLATDLVGGVKSYTRSMAQAAGVVPTLDSIKQVRDQFIPAALQRLATVGTDVRVQCADKDLQALSKAVAAIVPRPIPRAGLTAEEAVLNANTIPRLEQDLDAFESSLTTATVPTVTTTVDPASMLNADLEWLDLNSGLGAWVRTTYLNMTRNRHSNFSRAFKVRNIFKVTRSDRDAKFLEAAKRIGARRKGDAGPVLAGLQPTQRLDVEEYGNGLIQDANIFLGIHGTRSVNVSPIMGSHFRLPKSLNGVQITGAAFGHGVYLATDIKKSAQYVGAGASVYGSGGGIAGRGNFMFLCDAVGGKFHYPRSAWGIGDKVPGDGDSIFAHPNYCSSLQNDEHVVFDPFQIRIRYLVEVDV